MKKILMTILLLFFPVNLYAATLEVGSGYAYATIQAAVNASVAGDTVLVYPGTYNESVSIPDGKQGTSTSPIIIKAQYPARQPLDGGAWADTADKRSVVNAGSGVAGFYNQGSNTTNQSLWVRYIIIDGFYITGGGGLSLYSSGGGIFFENDDNIWIRNNAILNTSPYRTYNPNGEQTGNVYLKFTDNSLVQNNYFEYTYVESYTTSAFFINNSGSNNIVEYNEGYVGPGAVNGSFAYVRLGSTNFIYRYNYVWFEANNGGNIFGRFRDDINYTVTNNYLRSTVAQQYFVVHESVDLSLTENHRLNNNTFYFDQGVFDNRGMFGLGYQNGTEVKNNIFYSGINDTGSYAIRAFALTTNYSVTIDSNVYYNLIRLVDPVLGTYTETNTLNINPNINAATGCASSVDNSIYGANLNVSSIPYKKCDGTSYPIASKFGMPPSPPTSLSVQ